MLRVIVCGSREWSDVEAVRREIDALPDDAIVIHGCCRGADLIADKLARERGLRVSQKPADWSKHGKAAGPIRNQKMLDESEPHLVIAFVLPQSKGTWDMIGKAAKAGVETKVIRCTPTTTEPRP